MIMNVYFFKYNLVFEICLYVNYCIIVDKSVKMYWGILIISMELIFNFYFYCC